MKKNKEEKVTKVGSFRSITNMTKGLFSRLREFSITEAIKNSKKEDYIAIALSIGIVLILGIVLWLIPGTRTFITDMIPF